MAVIAVSDVNQWLGTNKLEIASMPTELAESQEKYVFGKLYSVYSEHVDGWTTTANTPALVKAVVSMRVAGHIYIRQYAEEASNWAAYGMFLLRESDKWIDQLNSGALDIEDIDFPTLNQPAFYPDDAASEPILIYGDWAIDELVIVEAEAPTHFTTGERF